MRGRRRHLTSADGTSIGLLTAGTGAPLLLVHGGMTSLERWAPLWRLLVPHRRVTAMDRRGRGSSGDGPSYSFDRECEDVAAVAALLAGEQNRPVDVFGHSYGATCALGAARDGLAGASVRRLALYEPPGPQTLSAGWLERCEHLIADGQGGRAMVSFLVEVVGLTPARVQELRDGPRTLDVLAVVADTLPREARALAGLDLPALARMVAVPVLMLLGSTSPLWAATVSLAVAAHLPDGQLVTLPGHGHEAVDTAPELIVAALLGFFEG